MDAKLHAATKDDRTRWVRESLESIEEAVDVLENVIDPLYARICSVLVPDTNTPEVAAVCRKEVPDSPVTSPLAAKLFSLSARVSGVTKSLRNFVERMDV